MSNVQVVDKKKKLIDPIELDPTGHPTFAQMSQGVYHDCLFSLSVIVNMGQWYEDRLITY